MKLLLSALIVLATNAAYADQCAYNDRSTAQAARVVMYNHELLYQFCANCGDTRVKEVKVSSTVNSKGVAKKDIHFRQRLSLGNKYWQFVINGASKKPVYLDLAYTYVYVGDKLVNVAAVVNCPTTGVAPIMEWDPSNVECDGACG